MKQLSPIEEKILEILFKDKIVTDILVDHLLPEISWTQQALDNYTPNHAYSLARENLKNFPHNVKLVEIIDEQN